MQNINGNVYKMSPGSIVILKPGDYHSLEMSPDVEYITVHFLPQIISKQLLYTILNYDKEIFCSFEGSESENIAFIAGRLNDEFKLRRPFFDNIATNLIENICYSTMRNLNAVYKFESGFSPMQKSLLYLRTSFMNNPSLEETANYVHLNPSYFSRAFKRHTGKTYNSFLNDIKLDYAKKLLVETNMTVTDVCFSSGFGSLSNFSRSFKQQFNISAADMRKHFGKIKTDFYSKENTNMQY